MTGPVLAFDVNATRGGKLTRITSASAPAPADPAPATATARFSQKAVARAEIASLYAGLLGVALQKTDLLERLTADHAGDLSSDAIAAALSHVGLIATVTKTRSVTPAMWPALAEMTSGQVILVLTQEGDTLTVYDTTCPDNKAEVPVADFAPVFSGHIIRADVAVAELSRRHAAKGTQDHWFWGKIKSYRRIIFEVALGSFVANLLAVAVALFSLQVYDRVIPNQSTATLWVLALGAGLAMLLEAFLRIARAADGRGGPADRAANPRTADGSAAWDAIGSKGPDPLGHLCCGA